MIFTPLNQINRTYQYIILCFINLCVPIYSQAQIYAPFSSLVSEIEKKNDFNLLFQDELINGVVIDTSTATWWNAKSLHSQLLLFGIKATLTNQTLLLSSAPDSAHSCGIIIRDAENQFILPYAVVKFASNDSKYIIGNASGKFTLNLSTFREPEITISYLGYKNRVLSLAELINHSEINVTLTPDILVNNPVFVYETAWIGNRDSLIVQQLQIGKRNSIGEPHTIRSLMILPSVSTTGAINDGVHVRGGYTDGLITQLDGMPIFSQSHLFGLVDSFNADAIHSTGLYYDIIPVEYIGGSSGVLDLKTRGSQTHSNITRLGLSNTAASLTHSMPLIGNISLLSSIRYSLLDIIPWTGNNELTGYGLNTTRSFVFDNRDSDLSSVVLSNKGKSSFYDHHGNLTLINTANSISSIRWYLGGDKSTSTRLRYTSSNDLNNLDFNSESLLSEPYTSANNWFNWIISAHHIATLSNSWILDLMAGYSYYRSSFSQEDFEYTTVLESDELQSVFIQNYTNDNQIGLMKTEIKLSANHSENLTLLYGISLANLQSTYSQESFTQSALALQYTTFLLDLFHDLTYNQPNYSIYIGERLHYMNDGNHFRWSPRFSTEYYINKSSTAFLSLQYLHQFWNRTDLYNAQSSQIWIQAGNNQPPQSTITLSTGYKRHFIHSDFTISAYWKNYNHLRLHEIDVNQTNLFINETPWLSNSTGVSFGLEAFWVNTLNKLTLQTAITLSKTRISNPLIQSGKLIDAPWDQPLRTSIHAQYTITDHLLLFSSLHYSTGAPARTSLFDSDSSRLNEHFRIDSGINYSRRWDEHYFEINFFIYNLTNRDNEWYRDLTLAIDSSEETPNLTLTPITVFDLGFQPSLRFNYSF